ncbi:hypothetical protein LTR94_034500, partial [Friedmanniomyces endolithicus]
PPRRIDARQGQDDPPGRTVLDHLTARRAAQIQHHAGPLGVAAETQTHDFAVRTEGQTARRRERDKADDDERQAGHRPFAHAPTAQIVTPPTQHQREIALQFRRQDGPRV